MPATIAPDDDSDIPPDRQLIAPHESGLAPRNNGDTVRASWQFSLHDIRANMAHCSEEGREAMISAFLWCIDLEHPVTRQEFADKIKYDPTTVWKVLAGKYVHPETRARLDVPAKMLSETLAFLALERDRMLGGRTEFIVTPTAKRIFTACELARESQTPVFITGPSHIGKTWALLHHAQAKNHGKTPYVRMKAASGLGGMVSRIAQKIGNSGKCNTAAMIDRIKNALRPNTLLILDELHLLMYTYRAQSFFACLEVIREIHDEVGCGLALCGTDLLLSKMKEGEQAEMEQLLRRGVHRVKLPSMPTKEDLTAIFAANALEFPDPKLQVAIKVGKKTVTETPRAVVRQLAKVAGLKAITERLRYGRKLAAKAGHVMTWEDFIDAHLRIEAQRTPAGDDWE